MYHFGLLMAMLALILGFNLYENSILYRAKDSTSLLSAEQVLAVEEYKKKRPLASLAGVYCSEPVKIGSSEVELSYMVSDTSIVALKTVKVKTLGTLYMLPKIVSMTAKASYVMHGSVIIINDVLGDKVVFPPMMPVNIIDADNFTLVEPELAENITLTRTCFRRDR